MDSQERGKIEESRNLSTRQASETVIANTEAQKRDAQAYDMNRISDSVSLADSKISTKSRSGKAVDKHCLRCNGKKFSGATWSRHDKMHEGKGKCDRDFIFCTNGGKCQQYHGIDMKKGNGVHFKITCPQCKESKRSDLFDKIQSICTVCSLKINNKTREQILEENSHRSAMVGKKRTTMEPVTTFPVSSKDIDNDYRENEQHNQKRQRLGLPEATEIEIQQKVQQYLVNNNPPMVTAPVSRTKIITIDQGQRDQQAVVALEELERSNEDGAVKSQLLLSLAELFTQELVTAFLEDGKHPQIQDLLLLIQAQTQELTDEINISIAWASIVLGGKTWCGLPKMLSQLEKGKQDMILKRLGLFLKRKFSKEISQWIQENWQQLNQQTLDLVVYLTKQHSSIAQDILNISRVVDLNNDQFKDFVTIVEVFLKFTSSKLFVQGIDANLNYVKLSLNVFASITVEMQKNQMGDLLEEHREKFLQLPVSQWLQQIEEIQSSSLIDDVVSVQACLNAFATKYGVLPPDYRNDIYTNDKGLATIIHQAKIGPNKLQSAIAQYSIGRLSTDKKQLWIIPYGQGKSRTSANAALIFLLRNPAKIVYMIYESEDLMNRDQEEFRKYWAMAGLQDRIRYHVGIDFESSSEDLFIFDEADTFILDNNEAFNSFTKNNDCICMTASPDDQDASGVEKKMIDAMGYKRFHSNEKASSTSSVPAIDMELPNPTSQSIFAFIQEELKSNAVLCYCSSEMKDFLASQNVPIIHVTAGIHWKALRELDQRTTSGNYPLLVATEAFAMRGFDYRAKQNSITLMIGVPFENKRGALQGLHRVGRFNDSCRRVLLEGVSLIDTAKEEAYYAKLVQLTLQYEQAQEQARQALRLEQQQRQQKQQSPQKRKQPQPKKADGPLTNYFQTLNKRSKELLGLPQ